MVLNGTSPDCPEANSSAVPHSQKEKVLLQRPNVISTTDFKKPWQHKEW